MSIQLSIKNLTKEYRPGEGVIDFSLDVKQGDMMTLLGPSGCGKTTVLRSIGGFIDVDSGEILIDNKNILGLPPEKRPTNMVFQGYNLWPHMDVYNNLAFGLKIRKVKKNDITKKVKEVLETVRLPGIEKKYPSELSGGQQQRVAVARALLLDPSVLLLDEPFSAIDAKLRHEMREEIRDLQLRTGLTMVFVTHDQEEALAISDKIVVMNKGKIEQISSPHEIYDHPKSLFVAQFIGKMNFVKGVSTEDNIIIDKMKFDNVEKLKGKVIVAIRPEDIQIHEAVYSDGIGAIIQQVMILGHYSEILLDTDFGSLKAFLPRENVQGIQVGMNVKVSFTKIRAYKDENN